MKFQHIKDKDKILSFSENPTHIEMFINENGLIFLSSNIGTWEEPGTKLSPLSFSFFFFLVTEFYTFENIGVELLHNVV